MKPIQILLTFNEQELLEFANHITHARFFDQVMNSDGTTNPLTEILAYVDQKLDDKIQTLTEQQPNPNQTNRSYPHETANYTF